MSVTNQIKGAIFRLIIEHGKLHIFHPHEPCASTQ